MTLHFSNITELADIRPQAPAKAGRPAQGRGLYRVGFKRIFETTLILFALPLVLPVMLVLIVIVASDGHNPFYSQPRVGRGGKSFRMWKLRTMVHDADAYLKGYLEANPQARDEWDATQKLKSDPRITRIGRFLRKASIDELPQLWNVLTGTMSLVGPRPMMVQQEIFYHGKGYYNLRPGITGLWQVSDRNESNFSARIAHDDAYDGSVSLKTDVGILMRTVSVVLRCTGY